MSLLALVRHWERASATRRAVVVDVEPQAQVDGMNELLDDGTAARLRAIAATLTAEEHHRLAVEAEHGDRLAELLVAVLAMSPDTEGV